MACRSFSPPPRAAYFSQRPHSIFSFLKPLCFYCRFSLIVFDISSGIYSLPRAEEVLWCDLSTCIHGIVNCTLHVMPLCTPTFYPIVTYPSLHHRRTLGSVHRWSCRCLLTTINNKKNSKYIDTPCLGTAFIVQF